MASTCIFQVADAIAAYTIRDTKLQEEPGTGEFMYTKLPKNTLLVVYCRAESSVIAGDPWWLKATALKSKGWVPAYDVKCPGPANCGILHHC